MFELLDPLILSIWDRHTVHTSDRVCGDDGSVDAFYTYRRATPLDRTFIWGEPRRYEPSYILESCTHGGKARNPEISDLVLPIRFDCLTVGQFSEGVTVLLFVPWSSTASLTGNIRGAILSATSLIALDDAQKVFTNYTPGVKHVTYRLGNAWEVITIYEPVPNSFEERPSMLDLLHGNVDGIDAIYNS